MIQPPNNTVIYLMEQGIKTYRKLAQKNLQKVEIDITVDQVLVLMLVANNTNLTQTQMADILFKDYASVTRIIELMVKKELLTRTPYPLDRRRTILNLTKKGEILLGKILPVVVKNREKALKGITQEEKVIFKRILTKIINNCQNQNLDKSVQKNIKSTAN